MSRSSMLHRFSRFVVACTVLLILAGSLVTSHDAGLSVPDWPTSYGWNMFTFPPSMWVANIFYEHGHRLIATSVGMLTIALVVWLWATEPRRWLRWLGVAALGAIVAQGVLGGITVLFFLPPAISTAHAALAEIFFCITVAIAVFTSPGWIRGYDDGGGTARAVPHEQHAAGHSPAGQRDAGHHDVGHRFSGASIDEAYGTIDDPKLRRLATATTLLIYAQILIGATMRHTGAGLAIPDFPLMFGHVVPDHWSAAIAIHFAHRVGALVAASSIATTAVYILRRYTDRAELAQPALVIVLLTIAQVTLGAFTVITRRDPWINSVHVVGGALVLTMSLVITLRAWRAKFPVDTVRLKPDTTGEKEEGVAAHADIGSVRLQPDSRGRA